MNEEKTTAAMIEPRQESTISSTQGGEQGNEHNIHLKFPPPEIRNVLINLGDTTAPVVMMFGPGSSGKTVALLRLTHHLRRRKNLNIIVDKNFRDDPYYRNVTCPEVNNFLNDDINTHIKPIATPHADFVAIDLISREGSGRICKFIEVPGEHLFDPVDFDRNETGEVFPKYVQDIFQHRSRKVIVFMMPLPDPEHASEGSLSDRAFHKYCDHIADVIQYRANAKSDHFIFAISKADQQKSMIQNRDDPNKEAFRKALENRPGFDTVRKLLRKQHIPFRVLPFSAGRVSRGGVDSSGKLSEKLVFGADTYPDGLWSVISEGLNGGGGWIRFPWPFSR